MVPSSESPVAVADVPVIADNTKLAKLVEPALLLDFEYPPSAVTANNSLGEPGVKKSLTP